MCDFPLSGPDTYGDGKIIKYEVGRTAYIVENNHIVREVTIVSRKGEFYTVRVEDGKGDIRSRSMGSLLVKKQLRRVFPKKRRVVIAPRIVV